MNWPVHPFGWELKHAMSITNLRKWKTADPGAWRDLCDVLEQMQGSQSVDLKTELENLSEQVAELKNLDLSAQTEMSDKVEITERLARFATAVEAIIQRIAAILES